jgi:hypothetical protein
MKTMPVYDVEGYTYTAECSLISVALLLQHLPQPHVQRRAESREQRAESREQKAESTEKIADSRQQKRATTVPLNAALSFFFCSCSSFRNFVYSRAICSRKWEVVVECIKGAEGEEIDT